MGDSWSCLSCIGAEEPPVSFCEEGRGKSLLCVHCLRCNIVLVCQGLAYIHMCNPTRVLTPYFEDLTWDMTSLSISYLSSSFIFKIPAQIFPSFLS